jgi:hypothetical protein
VARAVRRLREDGRHRQQRRGHVRLLRSHGAHCQRRRSTIATSIELWNKVIDLRGDNPMALSALAGLYEGAQAWRELVDILQRTMRITDVPEDRIPLHKRLGRHLEPEARA